MIQVPVLNIVRKLGRGKGSRVKKYSTKDIPTVKYIVRGRFTDTAKKHLTERTNKAADIISDASDIARDERDIRLTKEKKRRNLTMK